MLQDSLLAPRPPWLVRVLAALGRHDFLTAGQLAAVHDLNVRELVPVLEALVTEGLLRCLTPSRPLHDAAPSPAYLLTRRGAAMLAAATDTRPARVPDARKSLYTLAHDLARNEFALTLERLAVRGHLKLLRWETRRAAIADVVHVPTTSGLTRIPLVADGLALVALGEETTGFLVEQDQGTVSVDRMREKYLGYDAWWRADGPLRRFGTRSLRVLTVAPAAARLTRLRDAALDATGGRGSRFLWFVEQNMVTVSDPTRLLAPVCTLAHEDASNESLFPRLPACVA